MLDKPDYTFKEAQQQIINEYNRLIDYFVDKTGQSNIRFASLLRQSRINSRNYL